jgi:hypothetical protein
VFIKQINVVAFVSNQEKPFGDTDVPVSDWVQPTEDGELYRQFDDAGPDVKVIFDRMNGGNKWLVHALYPPLEKYVHKTVVLVGDAVSRFFLLRTRLLTYLMVRPMLCFRILGLA